jgi:hypothetical protein
MFTGRFVKVLRGCGAMLQMEYGSGCIMQKDLLSIGGPDRLTKAIGEVVKRQRR